MMHGFITGLSILPHCAICLSLGQCYNVLITVALLYCLKSRSQMCTTPFFFLKVALGIHGPFCFHTNCKIFVSNSVKTVIGNLIGITLNL